ncbi:MAG: hypothetical protein ACSHYF_14335 [Verrucomicrobiaceae bacterium]
MAGPKTVAEPHKELRFTRASQAQIFFVAAAVSISLTLIIGITAAMGHPSFHWWMTLPCALTAFFLLRLAVRCTRHAFLILTPLGIEVFPFIKPEKNLRLIYWGEIAQAEINEDKKLLTLHHNADKTSGIVVSLKPLDASNIELLNKAIQGRLNP